MLSAKRLAKIAAVATLVTVIEARTRKGDKLLAQSRAAEIRKDWDTALSFAEEALSDDPADIAYQLTATRLRFYDGQYHVDEGRRLRNLGKLDEALAEFERDPSPGEPWREVFRQIRESRQ